MKTIKIDLRFQRVGTTWCAIALVKSPYCPEPLEIITCIERTYHRRRRQARLGRLTPLEYETIMTPQTATAA